MRRWVYSGSFTYRVPCFSTDRLLVVIVRSLEPVMLLFALVFVSGHGPEPDHHIAQRTHHVPRFVGVILLILGLVAIAATIVIFAIPPLAGQTERK